MSRSAKTAAGESSTRWRRSACRALAAAACLALPAVARSADLSLPQGVASGDVTATSAVVWSRASAPAELEVEWADNPAFDGARAMLGPVADETTDFTAKAELGGLSPATRYWYRVTFLGGRSRARERTSASEVGTFATAPAAAEARPVSFVVGGDVGGQRLCRNADTGGYAIFGAIEALHPDFFVMNGDAIYADGDCPADGPAGWRNIPGDFPNVADPAVDWTNFPLLREDVFRHWRYNRADPYWQSLLRSTPMYSQWDDHEVINDFGARWTYWNSANVSRPGYPNLVAAGRDAFALYSPLAGDRIYRSFGWGKHVELFLLDARSYRDRNDLPDTPENHKTLLGAEQLAWLEDGLRRSTATWKIVSSDVPLSEPSGSVAFGRDGFANIGAEPTGFESELGRLLAQLDADNVRNVVFVVTDVHLAQTIAYHVDANGDGDFLDFRELVSGPLNAIRLTPQALDPFASPTSLYAEGNLFSFEYVRVRDEGGQPHLLAEVRGADGAVRPGSAFDFAPEP